MAKCERIKQTNNNYENIKQKTKDRATQTAQKLVCSGRVNSSYSTSGTYLATLVTNLVITHEK